MTPGSNTPSFRASLTESPLFAMLTREVIDELFESMEFREHPEGALLIEQGMPADSLMFLVSGAAQVRVTDHRGQQRIIATLGKSDVLGEMALLTREPRSADVITTSTVQALHLGLEAFDRIALLHPELAVVLTEILANRLGGGSQDMLGGKSIEGYRILRCVGRGGMAVVYEAHDESRGEDAAGSARVALKMMNHRLLFRPGAKARFQREADILMRLSHENITRVTRCFSAFRTIFLVMEFCDGQVLSEYVRGRGPLPEDEVRAFLGQLGRALAYLHGEQVIHRDLKPANVMMTSQGVIKLTDFGLARKWSPEITDTSLTTAGTIIGTPLYMAPEQIFGQEVGPEADRYAFGCLGLELLIGHAPFQATDLAGLIEEKRDFVLPPAAELEQDISEELHAVLACCLNLNPQDRAVDWDLVCSWAAPFGVV